MDSLYTCTPRMAKDFIRQILSAGLVPYVESSPGAGKSSIIKEVAAEFNIAVIDHRLSTSAPEDLN